MYGYALKKSFFDLWDHLFFALGVNLVYTLATVGIAALGFLFQGLGVAGALLFGPIPFLVAALLGGVATFWGRDIAVRGSAQVVDFPAHFAASWKASLAFGIAWLVIGLGWLFGIPFYSQWNPVAGFIFGVVMAWLAFFGAGMSLYYPGLNAQVEPDLRKLVRKSFLLFIANPLASFVIALGAVVIMVLSVVTLGFFPGIVGLALWLNTTFRFLLAKYEWMEANPEADHKKVPWAELVADDMDKVGPRTLRNMIFPWKD